MSWPVPLRPNKRSMRLMSTRSCETGHIMGTCLRGGEGLRWYFTHFTPTYIIHQHMLKYHDMSLIVVKRNNDMFWYEFGALKLETWFNAWCLAFLPLKKQRPLSTCLIEIRGYVCKSLTDKSLASKATFKTQVLGPNLQRLFRDNFGRTFWGVIGLSSLEATW